MKPLPVVPWTTEDCNIEWRNTVRHHRQGVFGFMGTQPADRRDAELMRRIARRVSAMKARRHDWPMRALALICVEPVFWPPVGAWEVDITYCA